MGWLVARRTGLRVGWLGFVENRGGFDFFVSSQKVGDVDGDLSFLFFLSFFDLSPYYAGKVEHGLTEITDFFN